ncbi:MAG: rhodanese-like domain-containing protein [Candidatus Sumerlaeota bacterium]|nr:rhodanese-like domain-containing protein [Candidatus Sumerlaeota bacterium]
MRFDARVFLFAPALGNFLDGRFNGNREIGDWIDLLERNPQSVIVQDAPVDVDGHSCLAVTADTSSGYYEFLIDPQAGPSIRQAKATIRPADLYFGKPLAEFRAPASAGKSGKISRIELQVRDVDIAEIDGCFLPVAGRLIEQTWYVDGSPPRETTAFVKRSNVQINPDFEALGAFKPPFPEGAVVESLDCGLQYIWRNGRLDVRVDQSDLEQLTQAVDLIPKEPEIVSPPGAPPRVLPKPNPAPMAGPKAYSGVYCLFPALKALGRADSLEDLLRPEYVGSAANGRALTELVRAATDRGLNAVSIDGLTPRALKECNSYAILRVRRDVASKTYDRYALFCGVNDGLALIFDPPGNLRYEPLEHLGSRWNGSGVIVSSRSVDMGRLYHAQRSRYLVVGGLFALSAAGAWWFFRRRGSGAPGLGWIAFARLAAVECVGLAAVALVGGMLCNLLRPEGLLACSESAALIQSSHLGDFVRRIRVHEALSLLRGNQALFVDARQRAKFNEGHVHGAINIPVDAEPAAAEAALRGKPKESLIVVYCSSDSCPYAGRVAGQLHALGYENLLILKGGWGEWEREFKAKPS